MEFYQVNLESAKSESDITELLQLWTPDSYEQPTNEIRGDVVVLKCQGVSTCPIALNRLPQTIVIGYANGRIVMMSTVFNCEVTPC